MRAYTIDEIDAMREAQGERDMYSDYSWGGAYSERALERIERMREEKVRTYMVAGLDPQDVVNKAIQERDAFFENEQKRREEERKKIEAQNRR